VVNRQKDVVLEEDGSSEVPQARRIGV
jgi:hypothetical protein